MFEMIVFKTYLLFEIQIILFLFGDVPSSTKIRTCICSNHEDYMKLQTSKCGRLSASAVNEHFLEKIICENPIKFHEKLRKSR